jgi:hypothetical protein
MPMQGRHLARLTVAISLALAITASGQAQAPSEAAGNSRAIGVARVDEVSGGCHSRNDCGSPLMGGLRIAFTGWACTSGFVARDPATSSWYLLTAGHCLADSGLSARWSNGSRVVGHAAINAFRPNSNADVGAIEIAQADASRQVFGETHGNVLMLTGSSANSSQTIGSEVCRSGATSGWTCGSIVATDVDVKIRGVLIRHTSWTDFPSAAGDSGAPIVDRQGRAVGILIATTATRSVYSTIDWIATELPLQPCVAQACD